MHTYALLLLLGIQINVHRFIGVCIDFGWRDDEDFVLLDEPTSGLDEKADDYNESNATAAKIMNFIIDYINKNRKRIVIIATHQALAELKYEVKNLYFIRKGNESKIILNNIKCFGVKTKGVTI